MLSLVDTVSCVQVLAAYQRAIEEHAFVHYNIAVSVGLNEGRLLAISANLVVPWFVANLGKEDDHCVHGTLPQA